MRHNRIPTLIVATVTAASAWAVAPPPAAASDCVSTFAGMTAAVDVEGAPATLTGVVMNAHPCYIGIYVGPGADGTVIDGVTVSGANDHGVLVQDVADVIIRNSTITGNGVSIHNQYGTSIKLSEDKALTLLGTTGALVENNNVVNNVGDGGISINDDGRWPSWAVLAPGHLRAAVGNVLRHNTVSGNRKGCAIVLSSFTPGLGVNHNMVVDNTVVGAPGVFPPVTGAIVVAADDPDSSAVGNVVLHNTVQFSLIPGIIVHSNMDGAFVKGTKIIQNTVIANNWLKGADSDSLHSVGIAIASEKATDANPSVLTDTLLVQNRISDEDIGIWLSGAIDTRFVQNSFTDVTTSVAP